MVFEKIASVKEDIKTVVKSSIKKVPMRSNVYRSVREIRKGNEISEAQMRDVAEHKFYFRKSFIFHASIYLIVNLLLFSLNMMFTPGVIWFTQCLYGWGIVGSVVHVGTYLMFLRGTTPAMKRAIIINSLVYATTIPYLIWINLTSSPTFYWFIYPLVYWGLGIVVLYVVYAIFISGGKKEKQIQKEMDKMRARGR